MVLSTDGHGELSRWRIEEGLVRGTLVHCGFDNDAGGNTLWQQMKEAYSRAEAIVRERPPSGAKDWNDALRAVPGRVEGQGQEDDRAPGRGRGYVRGHEDHRH